MSEQPRGWEAVAADGQVPAQAGGGRPPSPYPSHWEADVVASDGGTVHIRPIRPDDAERLVSLHSRLSERTRYLRYFGAHPRLSDRDVHRFTHVDYVNRVALIAELGGELLGVGRYDRLRGSDDAEVAFVVEDAHQGRGIGSVLLEHLAAVARERGIRRFVAEVLAENGGMVRVFLHAGYSATHEYEDSVLHLTFPIEPTEESVAVGYERERRAEARSMRRMLTPGSVAVIGASDDPGTAGHVVFANLLAYGFRGPLYPVNAEAAHVGSVRAYPSVLDVPDEVDLAVVAVPAPAVAGVVEECGRKNVRGIVVLSGGFSERDGAAGRAAERALVASARAYGMRVVGPNCLGVMNADPDVCLNATLAPVVPGRGRVGFFSQSGALGVAILEAAAGRGLGLSTFVSAGNRADVSGNDLLQYWEGDPATDVVLLYLESFGNPRKFARLARRLARSKPVVAVKTGRYGGLGSGAGGAPASGAAAGGVVAGGVVAGGAAAGGVVAGGVAAGGVAAGGVAAGGASTGGAPGSGAAAGVGARTAPPLPDEAVQAIFEASGVIRVETLTGLFDVAQLLAYQPLPAGRRVAAVTNSSALGVLVADACRGAGLDVAGEPADVGPHGTVADFAAALRAAVDGADAVVAVFVPPLATTGAAYAQALADVAAEAAERDIPVLSTFLGTEGVPAPLRRLGPDGAVIRGSVPSYPTPERAVRAFARVAGYAEWRRRPAGTVPQLSDVDSASAARLVDGVLAAEPAGRELTAAESAALLAAYGLRLWPARPVRDADEAVRAAGELGYPVALKASAGRLRHRQDLGAVRLDLADAAAVRAAWNALPSSDPGDPGARAALVQAMAPPGVATVVEVVDDPSFGALVSFGVGGVATDLLGDRAYAAVPLSDVDASRLVRMPRAAPLLSGYRGAEPVDMDAVEDLLLRVSELADDRPEVLAVTLNPVLVGQLGLAVLDARVRVGPPTARVGPQPRRMRD